MLQRAWRLPARKLVLAMPITVRARRARRARAHRPVVDGVVPARRAAVADRSGAVVERRDEPARAAARAPLPQPRVGVERWPRAARRAGLQRRAGDQPGRLRLVRVRPPGRRARLRVRRRDRASSRRGRCRAGAALARASRPPQVALRARRGVRDLRGRRSPSRRATASSPCSCARSRSASGAPISATSSSERADDIVEIVKLGIFVVFGSLLTFDGLFGDGWAAVGIVAFTLLLARPIAIWIALVGHPSRHRHEGASWRGSGPRAWRR